MNDEKTRNLLSHAERLIKSKDFAGALSAYNKAIELDTTNADAVHNRGMLLADMGRLEDAIADYNRSLTLRPVFAPALRNRGSAFYALGKYEEAFASYDECLRQRPSHVTTLYLRSLALGKLGRLEEALTGYDLALKIEPSFYPALLERANILRELGRFDEALSIYENCLSLAAEKSEVYCHIGATLLLLDRSTEALGAFNKALKISPSSAAALLLRGDLLRKLDRATEALDDYTSCIEIESPCKKVALVNRGFINQDRGLPDLAISDFQKAMTIDPDYPYLRGRLLHAKLQCASWSNFEQMTAIIHAGVRADKRVIRPFVYQAISESPKDSQKCAKILTNDLFPYNPMIPKLLRRERGGKRHKIRVGYLCGEFRVHATSHLMAGLYEYHDRNKFEIVAFDNGFDDGSELRKRLRKSFDEFIEIRGLSDNDAARKIRDAEIDILVNLNGYFGDQRMGVFAKRPSPIQVNYLGWPGTLGAPYIDYIIADRTVIPEEDTVNYDEKVVYLPHSYQANDSNRLISPTTPTRRSLGLPCEGTVFCNFNAAYKLVPSTFKVWMEILKEVQNSVLWLLGSNVAFMDNIRKEAALLGVQSHRIVFAPIVPSEDNLSRLKLADLFLDSLPYNGHTTASDALWAGVPVITCRGKTFPGRVGASLLQSAGLPELITDTISEYKALAIRLASDADFYTRIVKDWRVTRTESNLFDTELFARNIEAAYMSMCDDLLDGSQ